MLHFTKKPMNDWSDRWDRVGNNSEALKRDIDAELSKTVQMSAKWKPKPKTRRLDELYSLAPRCVRGASRSLTASSSDEFSWDSAPWSSLSFFATTKKRENSPSLLTASRYSSSLTSQWIWGFDCCFRVTVVPLSACRAEVTAADSYLRGCWRATGGARLLPLSSGSISKAAPCDWNHCQYTEQHV